jgi:hypothetical protein
MSSSGMISRVALVRTYVWKESITSIIKVKTVGELGKTSAASSNRSTLRLLLLLLTAKVVHSSLIVSLMMETIRSSETPVLTTATKLANPEHDILHSQRLENFKSYIKCCI